MTIPLDLDGAVAVITGAGSGIGRATALSLAARGARIAASDLDAARADETAAMVIEAGGEAFGTPVNVAEQADLERLRDLTLERFGRVDIVVNNVGVLAMGAPEALPIEAWQRVIDLNLVSVARSNLVFLPLLIAQGSGHVVNTSSASGLLAYGFDRLPVRRDQARRGRHLRGARALPRRRRASASPACAPPASPRTSSSRSPCTARRRRPGRHSTRSWSPTSWANSSPKRSRPARSSS